MSVALARVGCASPASPRLLRALAPFGLVVTRAERGDGPRADEAAIARVLDQPPGSIVLVTGPSGCGKSALVRAASVEARRRGGRVLDATALLRDAATDRPIIDLFAAPLLATLRLLSAAGLGEARLWARSAAELSDGQRARLGVALAMARTRGDSLIVIDEFCSTLDRVTARCVARTLRRWATARGARVVCATAHEDIEEALAPDRVLNPEQPENTA